MKISPQQYKALRFLSDYTIQNGEAPTYREIAAHCGIHLQTIVQKFRRLVTRGVLVCRQDKAQRAYELTMAGRASLAEFEVHANGRTGPVAC